MFTPFEELDALLDVFTYEVREILGGTFVGAYLQGSFALKAGDRHSDCDFIVATTELPSGRAESDLRRLHDEIPTRAGHWTKHLEGSYADTESLRSGDGLGTRWLYCDHGSRELIWDTHDNSLHARWILRHRGITLVGPKIEDLVDEVPKQAMQEAARVALRTLWQAIIAWAPPDIAWTQRYIVTTYCRILYSLHTGEAASKRGALEWAIENLALAWRPLLTQVIEDRERGWDPGDPPRPGSREAMREFVAYAESFATR